MRLESIWARRCAPEWGDDVKTWSQGGNHRPSTPDHGQRIDAAEGGTTATGYLDAAAAAPRIRSHHLLNTSTHARAEIASGQ